jgi:hypothetical protein
MADISMTDGSLIRLSGNPMNPDDFPDKDEEEDVAVTDDDLGYLEGERLLEEGDSSLPEALDLIQMTPLKKLAKYLDAFALTLRKAYLFAGGPSPGAGWSGDAAVP